MKSLKTICLLLLLAICSESMYAQLGISVDANANASGTQPLPSNDHLQAAQPLTIGLIDHLKSETPGEERILNIYLPQGYEEATEQRFPVIYLLDGTAGEDMLHIFGLVQFLNMIQVLPPTIVVGIANVDRKRDFTFPTSVEADLKEFPTTGGSEKFIAFIERDLQPYIANNYRVGGHNTIIGQSLGGLLATEILLKRPELFDQYIIVSPSLWWDKESLLKKAPRLLSAQKRKPIHAYISVGSEGKQMEQDAADLVAALKAAGDKSLKIDFVSFPEENHATILHRSVYKGLEILNKK